MNRKVLNYIGKCPSVHDVAADRAIAASPPAKALGHARAIEVVVAQHVAVLDVALQQDRHQLTVGRFQRRIGIDVQFLDRRAVLAGERQQRIAHRVAQMAIRARERA